MQAQGRISAHWAHIGILGEYRRVCRTFQRLVLSQKRKQLKAIVCEKSKSGTKSIEKVLTAGAST
jgi:hypothetical protein